MAFTHGMNVEAVRGLATKMDGQSSAVSQVISAVDTIVATMSSEWHGTDSTTFAGWWNDQHKPALQKLEGELAGLATSARNNAEEQESASR